MTITEYIESRGLTVRLVAQKRGVTRQAIERMCADGYEPTFTTLDKTARAMTELGAPTTVVELYSALHMEKKKDGGSGGKNKNSD